MSVRKRTWTTNGVERSAWQADYVDAQGKRRRKNFALKKDAEKFLANAKVEVDQGVHVPDGATITVKEAGKLWLKSGDLAGLERTTLDQRQQHLRIHITPLIGDAKLSKITAPFVRAFQDRLREEGRSPAMVRRVTVSLGSILADAQSRGLVIRNAVHELSRSRAHRTADKRNKPRLLVGTDIPTNDEIRAILSAASGRYRPLLVTMIFTGIRSSEARGLRWSDIDLGKALLHVRQRADKYGSIGLPKSDAGHRTIPLPPMAVNTLKEWKLACPKGELGLAFPNTVGRIEDHQNMLRRGLWPALIEAGVTVDTGKRDDEGKPILAPKYSGFHALRHWFASWCINRKVEGGLELSPKQVQERMGHSSIQVTFDTYAGLFPVVDETAAMAQAEQAIFAVPKT